MDEHDPYDDFSSDYPQPDQPESPGPSDQPPLPQPPGDGYGSQKCSACGADLTGTPIGGQCQYCGQPVGPGVYGTPPRQNGKAITSLVLGICSIPICFCYGVPSIIAGIIGAIFGSMATKEIAQGGYTESSRGMALAGKICSWIGIVLGIGYIIFFICMIAFVTMNAPQPGSQPTYPYTPSPSPYSPSSPNSPSSPTSPTYFRTPGGASSIDLRPNGQHRAKLPNGLEYGPNGQVRPTAPSGLQYSPSGQLQPAAPSHGTPSFSPGLNYP